MKIGLVVVLTLISLRIFAVEKPVVNFLGGAIYYDYNKLIFNDSTTKTKTYIKAPTIGAGISYDLLMKQFLFQFNSRFSSTYSSNKTDSINTSFYNVQLSGLFNYLVHIDGLNKKSGLFLGGGVGGGAISTTEKPLTGSGSSVSFSNRYISAIGNIGFMHTLDNTPFMWNVALSYNYNIGVSNSSSNHDLEDFQDFQVKVGLHYAF